MVLGKPLCAEFGLIGSDNADGVVLFQPQMKCWSKKLRKTLRNLPTKQPRNFGQIRGGLDFLTARKGRTRTKPLRGNLLTRLALFRLRF
jgi:hypothetical protein